MHRHSPAFRAVAVFTLLLLTASCATTQVPPISAVGAGFEPARDELALWERARDEEKQLLDNVALYDDPLLVDYLEDVVQRLNPPGMAANPTIHYRVRVVEDPTLNAFAYPHGSLYVHTGLLARMDNEDQLATVLGHEMSHVEGRHMLRFQRSANNKQIALSVAAITAAVILAGEQGDAYEEGDWGKGAMIGVFGDLLIGLGLQLAFLASVNGYGRNLETEADQDAFLKLTRAGYDLAQAPEVYQALLDDKGDPSAAEAFFFGSHPRLTERIDNSRQWIAQHPAPAPETPAGDPEAFARRIRPVVRDDARLNLEMGRLALAAAQLDRAREWMPEDPETHLLTGRLRLAQADAEQDPEAKSWLVDAARDSFEQAGRLDPGRPVPHRELALLDYREGEYEGACRELRRYVELAPEADDAPRMRDYLLELDQDGHCPAEEAGEAEAAP